MTFVGKILTVVIFLFSVVLMSLSFMVGATHKFWKEEAGKLATKITDEQKSNQDLNLENERLRRMIASEKTARGIEIARLEAALQTLDGQHKALTAQHQKEVEALGKANASLAEIEKNLAAKQTENDKLRDEIRVAQDDRDKTLIQVAEVADRNHQLSLAVTNLQRRGVELTSQIAQQRRVLDAFNLTPNTDITGIAPPLEAVVKEVRNNGQDITVAISIGSDSGLQSGHEMNVYRGDSLIGRVRIIRVEDNRAVGQSDPLYYKRPFQAGDIAKTFPPTASLDRQVNTRK